MINSKYKAQVALLLEIIEPALADKRVALKGGTAINLFTMNMPRLSVDLDLTYLPVTSREEFLQEIEDVFQGVGKILRRYVPEIIRTSEGIPKQCRISQGKVEVKIEVNLILRGTVYPPEERTLCQKAQQIFEKSVKARCVSFEDQYAGKFCAALDRQHPRDLYDVKLFFETYQFTENLKRAFLVYLISGNRPIAELINPNRLDQRASFENEFIGMTDMAVSYKEIEDSREMLISQLNMALNQDDRQFLLSFKSGNPNWDFLGLDHVQHMPAVKWKLMNIKKMVPGKHKESLKYLEKKLSFPQ